MSFTAFISVGLGGLLGAIFRYILHQYLAELYFGRYPISIFIINIFGSFIFGFLLPLFESEYLGKNFQTLKLFLFVGFCGSFTTFSTFAFEINLFVKSQNYLMSGAYVTLSILFGVISLAFGLWLMKQILLFFS